MRRHFLKQMAHHMFNFVSFNCQQEGSEQLATTMPHHTGAAPLSGLSVQIVRLFEGVPIATM